MPMRVIGACVLVLAGCGPSLSTPAEVPVGGVRAPIIRENLVAARTGMPGGLLEPGWLPAGFVLVNADYMGAANEIQSVDLDYDGVTHYLHIWQSHATPDQLGEIDPLPKGEPIEGTEWNANPLPAAQVGRPGVIEFSTRLEDGRTVTVDSDLDEDTMGRVLESLYLQDG
jgi:hypothetical protein